MGQYHKAINLTKGEYLSPRGCGAKLMEHSYFGNDYTMRLTQLLAPRGKWHGDKIVIAGDYSEPRDCAIPEQFLQPSREAVMREYKRIWMEEQIEWGLQQFRSGGGGVVRNGKYIPNLTVRSQKEIDKRRAELEILEKRKFKQYGYGTPDIYDFADRFFKDAKLTKSHEKKFAEILTSSMPQRGYHNLVASLQNARYFVNHDKREYIDCMDAIPQGESEGLIPVPELYIFPLTLLLSIANGRGGGDYHGYTKRNADGTYMQDETGKYIGVMPGKEYVGRWAGDRIASVADSKKIAPGYKHINPGFTERETPIAQGTVEQRLASQFPSIFSTKAV